MRRVEFCLTARNVHKSRRHRGLPATTNLAVNQATNGNLNELETAFPVHNNGLRKLHAHPTVHFTVKLRVFSNTILIFARHCPSDFTGVWLSFVWITSKGYFILDFRDSDAVARDAKSRLESFSVFTTTNTRW